MTSIRWTTTAWIAAAAVLLGSPPVAAQQPGQMRGTQAPPGLTPAAIQAALNAAYAKYRGLQDGANADYIPALAKVDSNLFGIALVTADGRVYTAGDIQTQVSIQSISKVFTMAEVIRTQGPDAIAGRIGVDATGMRFNSIVSVELSQRTGGPEMNALVNPGAIT